MSPPELDVARCSPRCPKVRPPALKGSVELTEHGPTSRCTFRTLVIGVRVLLTLRIFEFRKLIGDREKCKSLVPKDYPVYLNKVLHMLSPHLSPVYNNCCVYSH
ncbi:hypothetical protein F2P81_025477 [Scophthalmus maximus]|uniref:Uncharacterized protein n=1 Tax=Scophthalmus maximus TaxID=52904 RepID=A0A6A4RQE7_SCOMX|nr:hypothetical protein F2P81_025477 [Scophthalmus maximus]